MLHVAATVPPFLIKCLTKSAMFQNGVGPSYRTLPLLVPYFLSYLDLVGTGWFDLKKAQWILNSWSSRISVPPGCLLPPLASHT